MDIRISDFSLPSAFGGVNLGSIYLSNPFNLGNLWLKNISIKNNKLCKTNPISERLKMNISRYKAEDYENKSDLLTMEKQTQSNPTRGESVESICSELACTEPVEVSNLFYSPPAESIHPPIHSPNPLEYIIFLLKSIARLHLSPCYENT